MRPLVALGDLLSDIVEGLLCCRSPRAWFLTWRAWFLVLLRQRAGLLFAPPGRWATGRVGSAALRRWRLLLTLLCGFAQPLPVRSRAPDRRRHARASRRERRGITYRPQDELRLLLASTRDPASEITRSADRALHLEFDQPVHLDGVLHRKLLDDRLDEAVDDQLGGVFLGDPV
jgi:hypothetical protein